VGAKAAGFLQERKKGAVTVPSRGDQRNFIMSLSGRLGEGVTVVMSRSPTIRRVELLFWAVSSKILEEPLTIRK